MSRASFYYIGVIAIPLVVISTIIFWCSRHHWPINERAPHIILMGALIILAANALLFHARPDYDATEPCSLIELAVHVILLPFGSLLYSIRAMIILFKLEVTAELQARQRAHDHAHSHHITEHTPMDSGHGSHGHGTGTGAAVGGANGGGRNSGPPSQARPPISEKDSGTHGGVVVATPNNGALNSKDDDDGNRHVSQISQSHTASWHARHGGAIGGATVIPPSLAISTTAPVIVNGAAAAAGGGGSPIPMTGGGGMRPHIGINVPSHHPSTSVTPAIATVMVRSATPGTPPLSSMTSNPNLSSSIPDLKMNHLSTNASTTMTTMTGETKTFVSVSAPESPRGSTIHSSNITINPAATPLPHRPSLVHHSPGTTNGASRQVTINTTTNNKDPNANGGSSPGGGIGTGAPIGLTFMSQTSNHNGTNGAISRPASAGGGRASLVHHVTVAAIGSPVPATHHAHHHSVPTPNSTGTGGEVKAMNGHHGGHTSSAYTFGRGMGTMTMHGPRRHHRSNVHVMNWYVKNIWMIKGRFLSFILTVFTLLAIIAFIVIAVGMGRGQCQDVNQSWRDAQIIIATIWILIAGTTLLFLSRRLFHRTGFDILRMKLELVIAGVIVEAFGVIFPIMHWVIDNQVIFYSVILIWCNFTWLMMVVYPLYVARRHYLRQRALVNDVQRLTTLEQLMVIPEALAAFSAFLAKEFNTECLIFVLRASKFSKMQEQLAPLLAAASASAATAATATTAGNTTSSVPTIAPTSSMIASTIGTTTATTGVTSDDDRIVLLKDGGAAHHSNAPAVTIAGSSVHGGPMSPVIINIAASTKNPPSPILSGVKRGSPLLSAMSSSSAGVAALPSTLVWPSSLPRPSIALAEAYAIHRLFVEQESAFEVNLSATLRRSIALHLANMTAAIARERRTSIVDIASPATGMAIATTGGIANMPSLSLASQFTSHGNGGNGNGGRHSPNGTTGGHAHHHGHGHGTILATSVFISEAMLLKSILSTYDSAIAEVMKLMNLNSFARFRASPAYTRLIDDLQRQGTIVLPALDTAGVAVADEANVTSPSGDGGMMEGGAAAAATAGAVTAGDANADNGVVTNHNNNVVPTPPTPPPVVHTAWIDAPLPTTAPPSVIDLPPLIRLSPTAAASASASATAAAATATATTTTHVNVTPALNTSSV